MLTPQPEYERTVSFTKQLFQSAQYTDLYSHSSKMLSTETNKFSISKEVFRELVTLTRRYLRCEINIVPRVDSSASLPDADSKQPALPAVVSNDNLEEELEEEDEPGLVAAVVLSETNI